MGRERHRETQRGERHRGETEGRDIGERQRAETERGRLRGRENHNSRPTNTQLSFWFVVVRFLYIIHKHTWCYAEEVILSAPCVCMCVSLSVRALLAKSFDLWPWFLAINIKVMGQGHYKEVRGQGYEGQGESRFKAVSWNYLPPLTRRRFDTRAF